MISKKMQISLNAQLVLEAYASHLYLAMAGWFDLQGLEGCAQFMYRQSDEELMHKMRIFNYLLDMNTQAIVPAVAQPPATFKSVPDVFKSAYAHEQKVTKSINALVELAIQENDHATHNFLQWYVNEQREEETLMRSILDKINLIGDGPQSLYFIDKEIESVNAQQAKAAESESEA
ncbi:MAG TPA: ferritin [Saprospiraceae bacterium]|nr:ferritin [Saprospiraceae bacterium]